MVPAHGGRIVTPLGLGPSEIALYRLPPLLRLFLDGPVGTEEPVLPVALVLNKSLLKKIVIAVVIAAAETVLSGPAKSKVKR